MLKVINETGDSLTLKDRILHHTTAGLSTIEVAVRNTTDLPENFRKFLDYKSDNNSQSKTYIISKNISKCCSPILYLCLDCKFDNKVSGLYNDYGVLNIQDSIINTQFSFSN